MYEYMEVLRKSPSSILLAAIKKKFGIAFENYLQLSAYEQLKLREAAKNEAFWHSN